MRWLHVARAEGGGGGTEGGKAEEKGKKMKAGKVDLLTEEKNDENEDRKVHAANDEQ